LERPPPSCLSRRGEGRRRVSACRRGAGVLLQIAIVLGSVAILSESRVVLAACLIFGALAVLLGVNGFLLLVKLPV